MFRRSSDGTAFLYLDFLFFGLSANRFTAYLGRDHVIRLMDQIRQFAPRQGIQPVECHPLVSPKISGRIYVLALDEFCEGLRGTLKGKPYSVQTKDRKHFAGHLETESVFPLQFLGSAREAKTKLANLVDVHLRRQSIPIQSWPYRLRPSSRPTRRCLTPGHSDAMIE